MAANTIKQSPTALWLCGMCNHLLKTSSVTIKALSILNVARKMNADLRPDTQICKDCFHSLVKKYIMKIRRALDHRRKNQGNKSQTRAAALKMPPKAVIHRRICGLGEHLLKLPNYTFEGNSKLLGFARRINPELRRKTMVCMKCFKSLEKIYKLKAHYLRMLHTQNVDDTIDISDDSS